MFAEDVDVPGGGDGEKYQGGDGPVVGHGDGDEGEDDAGDVEEEEREAEGSEERAGGEGWVVHVGDVERHVDGVVLVWSGQ